jgi:hypothetical protein
LLHLPDEIRKNTRRDSGVLSFEPLSRERKAPLVNTNCGVAEKEDLELDPLQLAF